MDPGTRIRRLREAAGLTQTQLAKRAGTKQPDLSAYESGARSPSATTLSRIVTATGVRPSYLLDLHHDEVLDVVERHKGQGVWVFGSVARGEDTPESDLDIVVRLAPGASLFDLAGMREEIEELLGVHVDVVSERGLRSIRHARILADARAF